MKQDFSDIARSMNFLRTRVKTVLSNFQSKYFEVYFVEGVLKFILMIMAFKE